MGMGTETGTAEMGMAAETVAGMVVETVAGMVVETVGRIIPIQ
jgi:hypothetical protein